MRMLSTFKKYGKGKDMNFKQFKAGYDTFMYNARCHPAKRWKFPSKPITAPPKKKVEKPAVVETGPIKPHAILDAITKYEWLSLDSFTKKFPEVEKDKAAYNKLYDIWIAFMKKKQFHDKEMYRHLDVAEVEGVFNQTLPADVAGKLNVTAFIDKCEGRHKESINWNDVKSCLKYDEHLTDE